MHLDSSDDLNSRLVKSLILNTFPETKIAPENGWLEYFLVCFLLGGNFGLFSGANLLASFQGA